MSQVHAGIPGLLTERARSTPDLPGQWHLDAAGVWQPITWEAYRAAAARIASGLRALDVRPGDRIGVLAASGHRWDWVHLGILAARGTVIGLDPHDLDSHVSEVAERTALTGLFVQNTALLGKVAASVRGRLRFTVLLDPDPADPDGEGLNLLADWLRLPAPGIDEWDASRPEDPATVFFTSGTTGAPKGILYTHAQLRLGIDAILDAFDDIGEGSRTVSWLPLSNVFQRTINLCATSRAAQIFYVENPREIMRYVPEVGPHLLIGVPRFYEKLYAGMQERLSAAGPLARWLGALALAIGDRYARGLREGRAHSLVLRMVHGPADALVLRRFRAALGPNLRYLVSGSAPTPRWLLERYHAMGLLLLEGYALSEDIVPVSANRPRAYRFGTVGQPMRGNEIKLAPDGELLLRGPGVFSGYWGGEAPEEQFDQDGFLRSGDFAEIDADGFITLTGRKSEVFKTSTGRRVAPVTVEEYLRKVDFVEQAAVFGAGRKFLVAVLSVAASRLGVGEDRPLTEIAERVRAEVGRAVQPLPTHLRPAGVVATVRPFSIDRGELTANLKLRRPGIAQGYRPCLDELYERLGREERPFAHECEPATTMLLSL